MSGKARDDANRVLPLRDRRCYTRATNDGWEGAGDGDVYRIERGGPVFG